MKAPGIGDPEGELGASEEGKAACQGRGPESSPGLPQLDGAHPEPRIIGVWGREAPHEAVWVLTAGSWGWGLEGFGQTFRQRGRSTKPQESNQRWA